jgi:integrase
MRLGEYAQLDDMKMSEILARYLREIVPLKKTRRSHLTNIRHLDKALGHFPVSQLLPSHVVDFVAIRRRTVSSSTVRKEINALNHIIRTGVALWGVDMINPVPVAKDILASSHAIKESKPRNRRLHDGEEDRLLEALKDTPEMVLIVLLTLHTARRLKEILAIDSTVLVRRKGTLFLRVLDNKTDHPITVPLSERAAELLADFKGFTIPNYAPSRDFSIAVKEAGLKDLRLTDLRHESLSRLFERGFSVPEVMAISGHKTPGILLRVYSQVETDSLSEKLKRL